MNENEELLQFVNQNAEMGVNTIEQLTELVGEKTFHDQLTYELNEYRRFLKQSADQLKAMGGKEKGLPAIAKVATYLQVGGKTLTDRSNSHIAEMLISGSNMGIIDAVKRLHRYPNAGKEARDLMEQLLNFEEQNVEKLKAFL